MAPCLTSHSKYPMDTKGVKQPMRIFFRRYYGDLLPGATCVFTQVDPSDNNSQLVTPRHLSGGFIELAIVTRIWVNHNDSHPNKNNQK